MAREIKTRYQVCEIKNGKLTHFFRSPSGRVRMSGNRATMLTIGQAIEILRDYKHHDLFIQSEYDCHFREIDEDGRIINPVLV